MATSSFARRVLWSLVFFVCTTTILLATYVGTFGEAAQVWVQAETLPLRLAYLANKVAVDLVVVIIGATVPAVTGGLAILKGFYYAEMNLPRRLQELADAPRELHLHQRPGLLEYVKVPFDTNDFLTPTILANPFSKLVGLFGWVSLRNQAREFATPVDLFAAELRALSVKREDIENRKVTGHLLRAACYQAQGLADEVGSLDRGKHFQSALKEYEAVLELRPDDLDALEGAATQCHSLDDEPAELKYLDTIIKVAAGKRKQVQHARALRMSAAIIDQRSVPTEWNSARARLVTARRLIEHRGSDGSPEEAELAEILLLYGDVQIKREKFTAARKALNRAAPLFARIGGELGTTGSERLKETRARLDEAAGDKEALGG
jgi:tetratricopeptide (TPR) repeat protein